ncbi:MAG: prolipoprotein diacylglyceryl transferase [Parcubacteria group bacterium]
MNSSLVYYQHIPLSLDPIAFTVGSFSMGWYSLMYLVALATVYFLLLYRIKKDLTLEKLDSLYGVSINKKQLSGIKFKNTLEDFLLIAFMGALVGGRVGYVLLYNPLYYWHHLVEIVSPYDFSSNQFVGIYGMSYHGGLIGVFVAAWIFARKNKLNFWRFADFVVPAIPAGYFFGRIGNFLNAELYGRVTDSWMGMYFPSSPDLLRFPSQLIEALLEGVALFILLWTIRNNPRFIGRLTPIYLISYGVVRLGGELFRQPDEHIGYILKYFTLGQIFSGLMIVVGLLIYYFQKPKKIV